METTYRYILEKGSKKHPCPECHKKTFVYYMDTETGEYLPQQYGRCDRESKCGHHLSPYSDGYTKEILQNAQKVTRVIKVTRPKQKYFCSETGPEPQPVYFDFETFIQTLAPRRYEKNIFIQNLIYHIPFPFQADEVTQVIQLYRLGTIVSGYRSGAITFPFIDTQGNIRAVQVKQFDKANHTTGTDFLHSMIEKHHVKINQPVPGWITAYNLNEKKVSCLFGEHLLKKYPLNPVALVEAPKTAVYGTLYFGLPDESPENLIWLAVYNKSSFSWDKLKILAGRNVFIFPDLSKDGDTFKQWKSKAGEIEKRLPGTSFIFSDLLENLAPQESKNKGYDLADYLVQHNWRLFRKKDAKQNIISRPQVKSVPQPLPNLKPEPQPLTHTEDIPGVEEKQTILKLPELPESQPITGMPLKRTERKEKNKPGIWDQEISELETFFSGITIPDAPFILNSCGIISDIPGFIKSHLSVVKASNGKRVFLPYLERLQLLRININNHSP